jgi:predicted RNase H-like nuclease (RuvC/YqgF family)
MKIEDDFKRFADENALLRTETQELRAEIERLKIYIAKLETESAIYSRDRDHKDEIIVNLAQQPKTTTTTTSNRTTVNVTNNLSTFDPDEVKQRVFNVVSSMTTHDVVEGQRGLGRLIGPCLNNSDGTKMMTCSDYSRGIFLLKNSDGNIDKDIKCQKLVDLIEPITSARTDEIYSKECELRDKIRTVKRLRGEIEKDGEQVNKWESNLKGYKTDSHNWKQINDKIESLEKEIQEKKREVDRLVRELKSLPPNIDIRNDMVDLRLYEGARDIKSLTKDSTTFSKTVAENMQRTA